MTVMEAAVAIIVALLAVGGPVTMYINAKAARKETVTAEQGEENVIDTIAEDLQFSLEDRWKGYANDIELRLRKDNKRMSKALTACRKTNDYAFSYIDVLRNHIQRAIGPPPPSWPAHPDDEESHGDQH